MTLFYSEDVATAVSNSGIIEESIDPLYKILKMEREDLGKLASTIKNSLPKKYDWLEIKISETSVVVRYREVDRHGKQWWGALVYPIAKNSVGKYIICIK